MSKHETQIGGTGFLGLLTLIFIALKLTGFVDWNWIWVLSPLWGGLAISLAIVVGFMILMAITLLVVFLVALFSK